MRTGLSFGEILSAIAITALLSTPQAYARLSDYSTDMGEADVMTVKNDHCCDNARLQQEANVELHINRAVLPALKKINVAVLDENNQEVAHFYTHDRVVYMHLPEGKYTIKIDGVLDHTLVSVKADDGSLQKYTV